MFKKRHPFFGDKKICFKKGNIPWNKGKKGIYSPETIEKIRNSLKGKNSVWYGRKHTKNELRKMSIAQKGHKVSKEQREKISKTLKIYFQTHKAPSWKGGIIIDKNGYILIYKPNHPFCNGIGYVRRSHLIMEKKIGRYLKPQEVVHHKNEVKDDDREKNLQLFSHNGEHRKIHKIKRNKIGEFI